MIDVLVHNASGSAKSPAVLYPESGLIRYPSGQWSSVAGVVAKGCEVHEAKKEEVKPEPKAEEKKPAEVGSDVQSTKKRKHKS
jgi:hypothetical protein